MKTFILLFFMSFTACSSAMKDNTQASSFLALKNIMLYANKDEIIKKFGKPMSEEDFPIENVIFAAWEYKNLDRSSFQFLINPQNSQLVEKIYFPASQSIESRLQNLLKDHFTNLKFSQVRAKCAHHGALAYFNSEAGVFISTREESDSVVAITWGTPDLVNLRLKEVQNLKCAW